MNIRTLVLLAAVLSLAGCQLFEQRPDEETPQPEPVPLLEIVEIEPEPPSLSRAIDYLQDGDADQARQELERFLAEQPGHSLANRLLDQVNQPPEALLEPPYVEVTVRPGDSLSSLAAEYMGDSLMFHALARLNGIKRPRLLRPGTVLRVPVPDLDTEMEEAETPESSAFQLLNEQRFEPAFALLLSVARAGGLSPEGLQGLIESGVALSRLALTDGDHEKAAAVLEKIEPYSADAPDIEPFLRQQDRVAARQTYQAARRAGEAGDLDQERELLRRALELDPGFVEAGGTLADSEQALVDHYHDLALKAWRDQEVGAAVDLWEQVLEIDPGFLPAQIYLERARAVLRRLDEL